MTPRMLKAGTQEYVTTISDLLARLADKACAITQLEDEKAALQERVKELEKPPA